MRAKNCAVLAAAAAAFLLDNAPAQATHFGDLITLDEPVIGMLAADEDANLYVYTGVPYGRSSLRLLKAGSGYAVQRLLYRFTKDGTIGFGPVGGVTRLQAQLLGVSLYGGQAGYGTAFNLGKNAVITPTDLHDFAQGPANLIEPITGLTGGPPGVAYGAAEAGASEFGGIFQLGTSPAAPTFTILQQFGLSSSSIGNGPTTGRLTMDVQGSLFGLTTGGGELNGGTLYRLSNVAGTWQPAAFSFGILTGQLGPAQGSNVVADTKGHVFACLRGGIYGYGGIIRLTPPLTGTSWHEQVLAQFGVRSNDPIVGYSCALTLSPADGSLVGVSDAGGTYNYGTLFTLAPPITEGASWTYAIVHNFGGSDLDGFYPKAAVIPVGASFYGSAGAVIFRYTP